MGRRAVLDRMGRGAVAMAVISPAAAVLSACSSDAESTSSDTGRGADGSDPATGDGAAGDDTTGDGEPAGDDEAAVDVGVELRWARANLGFVSAYVLARGNSAAIVDTGVSGSADAIGASLADLSLTFDDVEHLILTHHHGDHVGSTGEVVARAASATVYAGQADLEMIDAPGVDAIVGLAGGEDVFGMEMVATPGHTPGHMSPYDRETGLLVAGDAIFTEGTAVVEGPERFFDDIPTSRETIRTLADLSVNTLLVGHGEPIEGGAGEAIGLLASSLP